MSERVNQQSPGIVGDIGERSDAHPVCEIESIFDASHDAAGIDTGASSHWVAVPRHLADDPVREFGVMTGELNAMADGLIACGVDTVALQSTGAYWIAVYEGLEQRGLKVWLVDARQMKYVPGRRSDVQDCQWLQKRMSLGLLRATWRPDGEVCVVRAVARQRGVLIVEQATAGCSACQGHEAAPSVPWRWCR